MRTILIVMLLCCDLFGVTRYASRAGSNSAPYTSWATAGTSVATVVAACNAGDTVRVGSGPFFGQSLNLPNGGTYATRTVVAESTFVDEATAPTMAYPTINGGSDLSGKTWDQYGSTNVWACSHTPVGSSDCWTVIQDDSLLLHPHILSTDANCPSYTVLSNAGTLPEGGMAYNATLDSLYVHAFGNGDPTGRAFSASSQNVILMGSENHVLIHGLRLIGSRSATVEWDAGIPTAGDSIIIRYCTLGFNSHDCGSNSAIVKAGRVDDNNNTWGTHNALLDDTLIWCNALSETYVHGGAGVDTYGQEYFSIRRSVFKYIKGGGIGFKVGAYADSNTAFHNVVTDCVIDLKPHPLVNSTTWPGTGSGISGESGIWIGNRAFADSIYGNYIMNIDGAALDFHNSCGGAVTQMIKGSLFVCNNSVYNVGTFAFFKQENAAGNNTFLYNAFENFTDSYAFSFAHDGSTGCPTTQPNEDYWRSTQGSTFDYCIVYDAGGFACDWSGDGTVTAPCNLTNFNAGGFNTNGSTADPDFNDPANGNLGRTTSSAEISVTYAGRTWTRIGAWQPLSAGNPDPTKPPRARIR